MLTVIIIAVGKLKEKYFADQCAEYAKRLSRFVNLKIIELKEHKLSDNPSKGEIFRSLETEAQCISVEIPKGALTVAMCIEGTQQTSTEFAALFADLAMNGKSEIAFIIGGSFGLSENIKKRSDIKISMSKMTFPHHMARVMLLEQIYRTQMIQSGGKYHK